MPELPEVETVRRGLEPAMEGARFAKVEVHRGDLRWPLPTDFAKRLEGSTVTGLGRRAKYLLADLVVRRRAGDASRHVGLVPCVRQGAPEHAGRLLSRALQARRPRPRGVSHVVRRHRHLQRSAPLRLDEARHAAKTRRRAAVARARPGAARQRLRRRDAGARLQGQENQPQGGAARISASSPGWAISMSARRCIWRGCRPSAWPRPSRRNPARRTSAPSVWSRASSACSTTPSRPAARRCAITS